MNIWYGIFQKVVNMSITGSIVILGVLLIRMLLCKAPKKFSYMLWGIVLFRLFCPISLPSAFSALNLADTAVSNNGEVVYLSPGIAEDKEAVQSVVRFRENTDFQMTMAADESEQAGSLFLGIPLLAWAALWTLGVVILWCSGMLSAVRLCQQVSCSMKFQGNVYLADHIASPFVLGVLWPRIYLPSNLEEKEQAYILLHEKYHIFRRDYLVKILAFSALCLHWFNPFVWLAFVLAGKDMEMSCDEAVMENMDGDIRAEYAKTLLHFTVGKRKAAGMPLAFGEGDVKSRIKNVMNYKKPAAAAGIIGAMICLGGGICFLTNPKSVENMQKPDVLGSHGIFEEKVVYPESGYFLQNGDGEEDKDEDGWEEAAIRDAIMEHNQFSYPESAEFACCSFVNLEKKYSAPVDKYMFYGWAYYAEYNFLQNGLENVYSSHVPVALKFQADEDGFTLEEYWVPGEGSAFVSDVRRKFPEHIVEYGLDSQKFLLRQIQDCYGQAAAFSQTFSSVN